MSDSINKVDVELTSLGYETLRIESPKGPMVSFPYKVETGTHKGKNFQLGISFQGNEQYPEYPPHWIHITPPLHDGKGGYENYEMNGTKWVAMSRPPGEMWDRLPTKSMSTYMTEHLRRFWNQT